jgi:hypothetical protein
MEVDLDAFEKEQEQQTKENDPTLSMIGKDKVEAVRKAIKEKIKAARKVPKSANMFKAPPGFGKAPKPPKPLAGSDEVCKAMENVVIEGLAIPMKKPKRQVFANKLDRSKFVHAFLNKYGLDYVNMVDDRLKFMVLYGHLYLQTLYENIEVKE